MWTTGELRTLRENAPLGAVAVAHLLGRSVNCVRLMASRQRISLRSAGERRGLVLGQAWGISLTGAIREDVVSGRIDAEVLAQRMALDQDAEICPACGHRPARVKSTGWCLVCHRRKLAEAHFELLEELDMQRAMNTGKQALCRARKAAES